MKKNEFKIIVNFILKRLKFIVFKAQEVNYKDNPVDFFCFKLWF